MTTSPTLFETLGGTPGLTAAVDDFYRRVVADPDLAPWFADVDMPSLRRHQVLFLSAATGGPVAYDGREMELAHEGLDVTDAAFDRVAGHLHDTLVALGVDGATTQTVLGAIAPLRAPIVQA